MSTGTGISLTSSLHSEPEEDTSKTDVSASIDPEEDAADSIYTEESETLYSGAFRVPSNDSDYTEEEKTKHFDLVSHSATHDGRLRPRARAGRRDVRQEDRHARRHQHLGRATHPCPVQTGGKRYAALQAGLHGAGSTARWRSYALLQVEKKAPRTCGIGVYLDFEYTNSEDGQRHGPTRGLLPRAGA